VIGVLAKTEERLLHVRYLGQFGEHILTESFTARDRGCAKTPAFNLRVEIGNQKCWRGLSEEGNRENYSTLSWVAHVFPRPGPKAALDRPGHELAPTEMGIFVGPVAVKRDDGLVFKNGLGVPVLRATPGPWRNVRPSARRRGQGLLGQVFGARNISRRGAPIESRTRAVSAIANQLRGATRVARYRAHNRQTGKPLVLP
jgi:hypothetical protein